VSASISNAAEQIGKPQTRYPSLVLGVATKDRRSSYTRSGAPIPIERSPRKLFERLFVQGKLRRCREGRGTCRQGRSTLDFVGDQAKRLGSLAVPGDRQRL